MQAMNSGRCSAALVGGVNIQLLRCWSDAFVVAGMLSVDNKCKFGDNGANGYVRGEGCGAMVLKTLDRVLADGDLLYCLVIGSAVNQDGHSNGLTAPNPAMQVCFL
jgi:acyl transferase domain-containing protein